MAESYVQRTLDNIEAQCKARGLNNADGFIAEIEQEAGKRKKKFKGRRKITQMNGSELKRLNRQLEKKLTDFLGGKKRADDS